MNFNTTVQYNGITALSKGMTELLQLKINSLAPQGDGVSITDRQFYYVPGAIPGDVVEAEVVQKNKKETVTELCRILTPSPHRRNVPCPVFDRCGGCSMLHADEALQRISKEQTLSRLFSPVSIPLVTAGPPLGYRRLARLHVHRRKNNTIALGFYEKKAHRVVDISECPILDDRINAVLSPLKNGMLQGLKSATLRIATGNEGVFVQVETDLTPDPIFFEKARSAVPETVKGIILHWNGIVSPVAGASTMTISTAGGNEMKLPVGSFGQANAHINQKLVDTVSRWILESGSDRMLELYAGAGNFSYDCRHRLSGITLVELDSTACDVAKTNFSDTPTVRIICDDALAAYRREGRGTPLVLLDPPRTGAKVLARELARNHHEMIIYVSCNPGTLKRDLAYLTDGGYEVEEMTGFDMFPQTTHVEVATRLRKRQK